MWLRSKTTFTVVVVILCLFAGLALGKLLARVIASAKTSSDDAVRAETTKLVLQSMGTLEVGDTLLDHSFEDLDGKPVRLSEVIHDTTWIGIIEPTCEVCVEDLQQLGRSVTSELAWRRFAFVSTSNPRYLRDLRDSNGVKSAFLYDHKRAWSGRYNFYTYPFHIRVSGQLEILEVVAGSLSSEQIESAAKSGVSSL